MLIQKSIFIELAYEQWMVVPNPIYDFYMACIYVAVCEQYDYVKILKSNNVILSKKSSVRHKSIFIEHHVQLNITSPCIE